MKSGIFIGIKPILDGQFYFVQIACNLTIVLQKSHQKCI